MAGWLSWCWWWWWSETKSEVKHVRITVGIGHRALGIGHPGHNLSSVWGPVSWFLGILAPWLLGCLSVTASSRCFMSCSFSFVLAPLWANYNLGLLPPYLTFFSTWPGRQWWRWSFLLLLLLLGLRLGHWLFGRGTYLSGWGRKSVCLALGKIYKRAQRTPRHTLGRLYFDVGPPLTRLPHNFVASWPTQRPGNLWLMLGSRCRRRCCSCCCCCRYCYCFFGAKSERTILGNPPVVSYYDWAIGMPESYLYASQHFEKRSEKYPFGQ